MHIAMLDVMVEPARPGASGLSDSVWHMARELTHLGDHVAIVGVYRSHAPLPPGHVRVYRLDPPARAVALMEGLGFTIVHSSVRAARKLLQIPSPDIVFAPDFVSGGIAAFLAPRLPVVCTAQGNIYERIATNSNPFGWPRTQVYKLATHLAVKHCAHIVAISEAMGDWWIRSGSPPDRISVIQRGTDVTFFRREPAARKRLGIEESVELVLFAGRFSAEKNVFFLLRAIAGLAPRRPALRLHLCGAGPDEDGLRSLAQTLGIESIVTFAGWVNHEKLRDYYSAADVFVLPSTSEPLGRVVLEAMACGSPVIASRVGGLVTTVRDGVTGFLVPDSDVVALADRIGSLIADADLRWRVGREGVRWAAQHRWPCVAEAVCREYAALEARARVHLDAARCQEE